MTSDIKFSVSLHPSKNYIGLVWNEFFLSRGRGVLIEKHFPWLFDIRSDVHIVEIYVSGEFAGGLSLVIDRSEVDTARIGLVCIDNKFRGLGLSRVLLEKTIDVSKEFGLKGVVLWTSKQGVYLKSGFEVIDNNVVIDISLPYFKGFSEPCILAEWDIQIPPFADTCYKYSQGDNSIYLVKGRLGYCLYHYIGCDQDVLSMLNSLSFNKLTLHLNKNSTLLGLIREKVNIISESNSDSQMWLTWSDLLTSNSEELNKYTFSDRI
ncbi:GNAT family N-acetyltransferase [Vibrio metoecus]|uniref:GNAT family N-acetyltransferase n=1 Tax=Vibrio metoecus TaxID=1481663 RepID=UPI0001B9926B|nr:GNAT family N-acetyltransferase [Vibrio metoecus]EEX67085.1 hypothetical protein VCJ_000712 [Vibrio metoecus]